MNFRIDLNANGRITRPIVLTPDAAECYPIDGNGLQGTRPYSYTSYQNNVLAYDMNCPAGAAYYHKPRGSWKVNRIYANPGGPRVPAIDGAVVYVEFDVTEPLLLSPFVFGSGHGKQ